MQIQRSGASLVWAAGAERLWTLALLLLLLFVPVLLWSAPNEGENLQILKFKSNIFANARELRVLLPDDYFDPVNENKKYPVLYLNDGQNLFDESTAVFGTEEWQVDETVRRMVADKEIPPIIVVGIDNAGHSGRAFEYLPYPDESLSPPVPEPKGSSYPEFLEREVIPFVEKRYRAEREAGSRAFGGSSYGALIALHTAINRPGLFSRLLLESPSFYVDGNHVLRDVEAADLRLDRVYLGVGTNELALDGCPGHPGNKEVVNGVRKVADLLKAKGVDESQVYVIIETCAEHSESAWALRFPLALKFLFGD